MRKILAGLVIAAAAFCFVPQKSASGATVTLQQGSAGYSGCVDTYIYTEANGPNWALANTNYGTAQILEVHREHYVSYY